MKRKGDELTVIDGLIVGNEGVGVVALLTPRSALSGPSLDHRLSDLLDHLQRAMEHLIPRPGVPRGAWQQPTALQVPHLERVHARPLPPIFGRAKPRARRDRPLADGTWTSALLLPSAKSDRSQWQWLRRLVNLSGLGWAFVVVATVWELFALAFSQRAGWGLDKGAFFFAWGLGTLVLGFYLRSSRKRPAVSRLFLGVNILVLSILSLVVTTR